MATIALKDLQMPSAKELMRGHKAGSVPKFHEYPVPKASDIEKETEKVLKEMEKELDRTQKELDKPGNDTGLSENLAKFVQGKFDESAVGRRDVEERWLADLRQYRGQYLPEVLARISPNRSAAYIRMTRTKVKTVNSRQIDFLFPANGARNWDIEPTPIPDYDKEKMAGLILEAVGQTGTMPEQLTPDMMEQRLFEDARKRSEKMRRVIHDQLTEMQYRDTMRAVCHSGNLYGTGILKGPMVSFTTMRQYKKNGKSGRWEPTTKDTLIPHAEFVSIWDIFPDLSAVRRDDCRHITQRHVMSKHKVSDLARRTDFKGDVIREYLRRAPDGDHTPQWYETELRSIGDINSFGNAATPNKRYEVLEFWGFVDAEELERAGVSVPDKMKGSLEVMANIWTLGGRVIKASISPLEGVTYPYFFYYYDKDETSIFGEGIASIMRDPQELFNSAFRAMLDHAAITAGPQIEVNLDLLSEDEDPTDVRPFKVWGRTGTGMEAAAEAIRVVSLPSHTAEYLKMIEAFEKFGDEVTTIPRYMWGDQVGGAGRTASGLSMMMGSANITIKDQVKNFDDGITAPFISAMYHWNMQFNNDETIKGDYNVVASGTSSLMAREVYSNSLMQFANITNNNVDLPITRRAKIIRSIADALDLGDKDLVLSDREVEIANQQSAAQEKDERQFMLKMVETARNHGISPADMIENMRMVRGELNEQPQQPAA